MAKKYTHERNLPIQELPADYKTFGRKAPHIRNDQIIKLCDKLIAFWDGKSKGTQSVIKKVEKAGKLLDIFSIPAVD